MEAKRRALPVRRAARAVACAVVCGFGLHLLGYIFMSEAFFITDLEDVQKYKNCAWCNLSDADLSGVRLPGANLFGTTLSGANLAGADLSGAKLNSADLTGANLAGADLTGANLTGADLRGANLKGANLSGTDLRGADLSGAVGTAGRKCKKNSVGVCRD
ncbi:MAG: pentapeptide repeat-containing protein [Thermodesulfovibrionales bacterium]